MPRLWKTVRLPFLRDHMRMCPGGPSGERAESEREGGGGGHYHAAESHPLIYIPPCSCGPAHPVPAGPAPPPYIQPHSQLSLISLSLSLCVPIHIFA